MPSTAPETTDGAIGAADAPIKELTLEDVNAALDAYQEALQAWNGPMIWWRGREVKALSEAAYEATNALTQALDIYEVVDDVHVHELVLLTEEFLERFHEWAKGNADNRTDDSNPGGTPELWHTWEQAYRRRLQPRSFNFETVEQLTRQNVGDTQICKMVGLLDATGNPDFVKLAEERANPGSVINYARFVPPHEARRREELAQQWAERQAEFEDDNRSDLGPVGEGDDGKHPEAPETLDELIAQRVGIKQIAKMKRISEDEVRARAAEVGVAIDHTVIAYANRMQTEEDASKPAPDGRSPEQVDLDKQLAQTKDTKYSKLPKEKRILAMAADGMKAKQIADALQVSYPGISWQMVNSVILKAKQ